jgi:iron complex transport system permease protein
VESFDINIIRVIIAFLGGYFLSVAGSLTQLITQNQMAAPSTLGFDGLIVLIILVTQVLLSQFAWGIPMEWLSFILFIILFLVISVLLITKKKGWQKTRQLGDMKYVILIGLGFNLFIGAIFSVVQFLFMALNYDFPSGLWFGSFRYADYQVLTLFSLSFLLTLGILLSMSKHVRVMGIGRDFALGLNVPVEKVQKVSLLLSLYCTGLVIAFFGVFSFLGLILPHVLRTMSIMRKNMRNELVYGSLLSGVFLSVLDVACYNLNLYGAELPVGMVSSVIGSFLLILLLFKSQLFKTKNS